MPINVNGAEFIGSGNNFDLFKITTWEAAQQFIIENRANSHAGGAYVHDENTFNNNINNDNHNLYFFTSNNTNQVYSAALSGFGSGDITFKASDGTERSVRFNFQLENAAMDSCTVPYNKNFPLYLIPNSNHVNELIVNQNIIVAALPQVFDNIEDNTLAEIDTCGMNCEGINNNAFKFGLNVDTLILSDTIQNLGHHVCDNVNHIYCTMSEKPISWADDWNAGKENVTVWNYGQDPEEVERLRAERAEQARLEQERREREEAERREQEKIEAERKAEEERRAAEREARKLRYKVVGKEVTITGTRKGITELNIPAEIEGKPVTRIDAYAFYGNEEIQLITFEDAEKIKQIGERAFAECPHLRMNFEGNGNTIAPNNATYNSRYVILKK